jgi:hypothetical protein
MTLNSSAVYRIGVAVFWNTSWNLPQSSQPVYLWHDLHHNADKNRNLITDLRSAWIKLEDGESIKEICRIYPTHLLVRSVEYLQEIYKDLSLKDYTDQYGEDLAADDGNDFGELGCLKVQIIW